MAGEYFSYKSDEDFLAECRRLNVPLRLAADVSSLWAPLRVGKLTIGNRLAVHPMEGCDGTADGRPDELTFRRWERFGGGGCKLIWGEATAVTDDGRANPRQLWLDAHSETSIGELVGRLRAEHRKACGGDGDLVVVCQLTHSGRYSFRRPIIAQHDPCLDPITLIDKKSKAAVTPDYPVVTDDWLERLEDAYVAAAGRAFAVGFDAIDLKQCHRYLLNELLAGKTRAGRYGGGFENRTRFIRNVIGKIRAALGDVPIFTRMNAYDGVPYMPDPKTHVGAPRPFPTPFTWGFGCDERDPLREDLTEPLRLVGVLRGLGVGMINVSMGNPYAVMHVTRPFELPPVDGYTTPEHPLLGVARHVRIAAALQQAYPDLPMVGSGYSWLRHLVGGVAAANIADGKIAAVGVGRGAFAYPQWANDLKATGTMDAREACIAVSFCTALMRAKGNELGQFPSGCVPRDKLYAPIYKDALKHLPPAPKSK
jgi:2,4-dienoyl-CoA reductase-like NADH-dependent reductase (Old Yellow Enzyme family)